MRAPDGLGQPPEGEQTEIGVGSPTDPADDDRQQLALDRGATADPLGEGLDVAQGPVGIRVADCGKTLARRLRTQSHLIGAEGGREGQQGTVVDLLVEGPYPPAQVLEVLPQTVSVAQAVADAPLDAAQVLLLLRKVVGAAQPEELAAVLQQPQGLVAAAQGCGVGAADVSARAESVEGLQGGTHAQALVGAAVDELEELDGELDVPQSPGAQLDTPVHSTARHGLLLHPAPHGTGVLNEVLPPAGLPHVGRHALLVADPELGVAGAGPGLEQGLELPGGGPPAVVGQVGVKRAHERTVLALGAQRRVQWPQRRLGRGGGDDVSELSGQVRADLHEALLADRLLSPLRLAGGADDVDDVDVRDVVELAGPGLSHGDHCEGHVVGLRSDGGAGDEQGRVQGGVGKLGHAAAHGGDVLDRVGAGEVIGDDRREPVPVGASQRRGRPADGSVSRVWGPFVAVRGVRIHGGGLPQRVADRPLQRLTGAGLLRGVPRPVRRERGEALRMGHEEVAQGLRGAQDREQAAPVLTRPRGRIVHDAA